MATLKWWAAATAVSAIVTVSLAHPSTHAKATEAALRVEKTLVLITASVTDSTGRFVTNLDANGFELRDNGKLQRISSLAIEDGPLSLCIVLDTSKSMERAMPHAREAVRRFLARSLPEDKFMLVTFRDKPTIARHETHDLDSILSIAQTAQAHGNTALFDALVVAMHELRHARHKRRAIVVISDGSENNSRYTRSEVLNAVRETDVAIYSIHLRDWSADSVATEYALRAFAEESGGQYWKAKNASEFAEIAESLDVRRYYVLGFSPDERTPDGKYRQIAIRLRSPSYHQLHLTWRRGYFMPTP